MARNHSISGADDCPKRALPAEGLQLSTSSASMPSGVSTRSTLHAASWSTQLGPVGVVLDCASGTQRHAQHHADCVECLRVHHAEGDTWVATGELRAQGLCMVRHNARRSGNNPRVHRVGVLHVAFSGDGVLLATVGARRGRCRSSRCSLWLYAMAATPTVCRRCSSSHTCS